MERACTTMESRVPPAELIRSPAHISLGAARGAGTLADQVAPRRGAADKFRKCVPPPTILEQRRAQLRIDAGLTPTRR